MLLTVLHRQPPSGFFVAGGFGGERQTAGPPAPIQTQAGAATVVLTTGIITIPSEFLQVPGNTSNASPFLLVTCTMTYDPSSELAADTWAITLSGDGGTMVNSLLGATVPGHDAAEPGCTTVQGIADTADLITVPPPQDTVTVTASLSATPVSVIDVGALQCVMHARLISRPDVPLIVP